MTEQEFPSGWDLEKVKALADYYDNQSDEEAIAELDAAMEAEDQTLMMVPADLVPTIHELIAKHESDKKVDAR
jgi:hypothetical protein